MRLIDADALKAEWYRLNNIDEEDRGARFVGYQEIPRLIDNAPTVQPTGDLISRADAIDAVLSVPMPLRLADEIDKVLRLLPSAEADWIPCSERLPKEDGAVLVWLKSTTSENIIGYDIGSYFNSRWWLKSTKSTYRFPLDQVVVIAWKPLPKPYREDGE